MMAELRPPPEETTLSGRHGRPCVMTLTAIWDGGHASVAAELDEEIVIGRDASCDLRVEHPSVSRRHARFVASSPPAIVDLDSRNGTHLGDVRLAPGRPSVVAPTSLVKVGDAFVAFVATAPQAEASAGAPEPRAPRGEMARLHALAELVAQGGLSVLVTGETGAGKEILSERIHARSPRARRPLVKINCAALPEHLVESELFGHRRGAFTGAVTDKPGLLEQAHQGTLLLDEVGELPLAVQAKLLRVLESREVRRLGAAQSRIVDVRFVAATNRDLRAMIADGRFRADLYYRLASVVLAVPPLRERKDEIPELATRLLADASRSLGREPPRLTPEAMRALVGHAWPGNIRELRNAMDQAAVLSAGGPVTLEHMGLVREEPPPRSLAGELAKLEQERILEALEACGGNQTRAAAALGIARRTLIARLDAWGVPRPRKGPTR